MADTSAIRTAIQSRLSTLVGNNGNSYAYWQERPESPCFQILGFGPVEYDEVFQRGGDALVCTVQGVAGKGLDEAAQRQIDSWTATSGSGSVKAALETERTTGAVTLGSVVAFCRVTGHTRPVISTFADGTEAWTVDFTLEIHT